MKDGRCVLAVLLIAAAALALRVPQLGNRPLHNDEAVNAFKATELWQDGRYAYDPDEYHGPTLHYATLPFLWASGVDSANELPDRTLRFAPVAFGVGLILLLFLFRDGLGRPAMLWAAAFTALSPAMVFYSRYFIHEMLLVFFTALTLGAGWRYTRTRSAVWALLTGAGLGLMATTKETFVLSLAAMFIAGSVTAWSTLRSQEGKGERSDASSPHGATASSPSRLVDSLRPQWNWRHAVLAGGVAAAVWLVLFTSFFTHARGPLDSVLTYLPWLKRAGGESFHIHPWHFYLHRLAWFHPARSPVWTEGLILGLAMVGAIGSFGANKPPLPRFLAIYTLSLTAIYSAISYKTPWCLLGFLHGLILLAGVGAATLLEWCRARGLRIAVSVALAALTMQLAWQSGRANFTFEPDPENRHSWRANFAFSSDPRNPYVYAQTSPNLLELMKRVDGIARVAPTGYETVVKVMAREHDYWPVPWYLRRFPHVGFYAELPQEPYAPVMLVSAEFKARYDDQSERKWIMAGIYALRPGKFFELYVELELWKQYVATLPRPVD